MYTVIPRAAIKKETKRYSENTIDKFKRGTKNVQRTQKKTETGNQRNKNQKEQIENNKMVDLNLSIPIITLNLNGVKTPIKKHRLSDWMKK